MNYKDYIENRDYLINKQNQIADKEKKQPCFFGPFWPL